MQILDAIKEPLKWIPLGEHVALLQAKLADCEKRLAESAVELRDAKIENAGLKRQVQSLSPSGFEKVRGLLWMREGDGFEPTPYCPKCQGLLLEFPRQMHWTCSGCQFSAAWCRPPSATAGTS